MDDYGSAQMQLPRPGRALKTVLVIIAALGIFEAIVANWMGHEWLFRTLVYDVTKIASGQVWRLITSGLLTNPQNVSHLLFTLMGLYFLGTDLERRWGGGRFIRFLGAAVLTGNLLAFACGMFASSILPASFIPGQLFGASAALTAIAIAWSVENATATVRFMFFLPVTGRALLWISLGLCAVGLIYPNTLAEGPIAPIGGALVGLTMAGRPSLMRRFYLQTRLALLRRRGYGLRVEDVVQGVPPLRKPRSTKGGGPPLRVVQGGLEEVLRQRNPPKDKRHLN